MANKSKAVKKTAKTKKRKPVHLDPASATVQRLRSYLLATLRAKVVSMKGLKRDKAIHLGIAQTRLSRLMNKTVTIDFSIVHLVELNVRAGTSLKTLLKNFK